MGGNFCAKVWEQNKRIPAVCGIGGSRSSWRQSLTQRPATLFNNSLAENIVSTNTKFRSI